MELDVSRLCPRDRALWEHKIELHGAALAAGQFDALVARADYLRRRGYTAQEIREHIVGWAWDSRLGMRSSPAVRMANIRLIEAMVEQALEGVYANGRTSP